MQIQEPNFRLSLRFFHPKIDPERITNILSLTPDFSWREGDQRKTPKGGVLDGVYKSSYWCYTYTSPEKYTLYDYLKICVDKIVPHKALIEEILAGGGRSELYLTLPGAINAGEILDWGLLKDISLLKLDLSIEVMP